MRSTGPCSPSSCPPPALRHRHRLPARLRGPGGRGRRRRRQDRGQRGPRGPGVARRARRPRFARLRRPGRHAHVQAAVPGRPVGQLRRAGPGAPGLRGAQAHRARDRPGRPAGLLPEPLGPHHRLQGHAHHAAAARLLPRPLRRAGRERHRPGALAVLHQHVPLVAAGPPVPLPGPQRRDQHGRGQPQLDARPRGAARQRPVPRRPRAGCSPSARPVRPTPPASTRCSSCCTSAAARSSTPC